jgi:hypothetical protein
MICENRGKAMLVSRDPFAREEIHKESVTVGIEYKNCAWCGCYHTPKPGRKKRLWRFRLETDGGRVSIIDKLFCSIGCYRDYYCR